MRDLLACLIVAAGLGATSLGAAAGAAAAEREVTLAVEGMTCASCPYMVRQALLDVAGVQRAEVSYEQQRAWVTYDDEAADVDALTQATADIGFPAAPVREPADG